MSTKYKFHDQDQLYFVSFAVINWIDLFVRNEYKDIMLDSWRHCRQNKGLEIYGWCIMTSHIHMIIGTHGEKLENIMRDMKKHTSVALRKAIEQHPAIVEKPEDYLYSSARDYCGMPGLIDIILIDPMIQ